MKGRKDGRDIVRPEDRVRFGNINLRVEWKTECKVRRNDKRRNASCDNVARVRGRKMSISNIVDNLSGCCESVRCPKKPSTTTTTTARSGWKGEFHSYQKVKLKTELGSSPNASRRSKQSVLVEVSCEIHGSLIS